MNEPNEPNGQKTNRLQTDEEYDFYRIPFPGSRCREIPGGRLRITRELEDNKYFAEQCGSGEAFFVKSQAKTSEYALPYALSEIGCFDAYGETYYLYERYDGSITDWFQNGSKLENWLTDRTLGMKTEDAQRERERVIASVFLTLMFSVRSLYCYGDLSNFDIKAENVVYKIDGDKLTFKMIDFFETIRDGYYHSELSRFQNIRASLFWAAPVIPYLSYNNNNNDGIARTVAGYCDIYSMGVLLYWLYTKKQWIWKEPWDKESKWYETYENGSLKKIDNVQMVFQNNYRPFYYGTSARSTTKLKDIEPSALSLAHQPERMAALIEKMLSFPTEHPIGKMELCDDIITEYCGILSDDGCLPDNIEIPLRYLPPQAENPTLKSFVLTLCVQMLCNDGTYSTYEEYRCLSMREGDAVNVPLVVYRLDPTESGFREEFSDLLFLYHKQGRLYYRTTAGLPEKRVSYCGANFGELTRETELRFSVTEKGQDTFILTIRQREGMPIDE